ncbi:UvrD-helicase domain-containing protein [Saccharopolyspora sp. ASAGF58]|uniref:UvrD-helicase domain-containing protein n=1 Tax=Saccharopolyspora sp. ASAGF58 TaxID=2719023 RepID=UPI00143FD1E2|nr:UvrD-helicase domain-containing protein [Saccharopolyspora sp. ASAGF58]QIZ36112.1 DNA helicase UvrD [Saccharopolyspora sp. ASAGF58]
MTGTFHRRQERLRREAEEELRDRLLPTWQNRVLQRFVAERDSGWYTLLNQFAPHTPGNRPDAVLVGPLGVLVVLLRESEPEWEAARAAFRWTAELLAGASIGSGRLTESVARTVVVHPADFKGRRGHTGEHLTVTEAELDRLLRRGDQVLTGEKALAVARHLDTLTFDLTPIMWNPQRIPQQRAPAQRGRPAGPFGVHDLRREQVEHALDRPFRDWRIFLDDAQLAAVRRHYSGPARITGPAGTGKSVLALHRLAHLARRSTGKLLFTTHLRNLPLIAEAQFRSLAPQLAARIEFTHLHSWAWDFLAGRGRAAEVDEQQVEQAFDAVWQRSELTAPLRKFRGARGYWKDEINRVIKGRGIRSLEIYRTVPRKGRGVNLPAEFRAHVWQFYCEYERALSERGVFDHNDVLMRALAELERHPLPRQYTAVVVDEVQDLTLIGLRLVHAISGDGPNQLLLVGDGQQQVYAGGWRLSEAGISLQGRGEILRRNYRNRTAIVEQAGELDAINRFDDLDGGRAVPLRSALPVLRGGRVVEWQGDDQDEALVSALRRLDDGNAAAVLTRTNGAAEHWEKVLRAAGFAVRPLDRWDGRDSEPIHVGTVHRAKGTEFRSVFLPDEPLLSGGHREEREALHRQRLVAVTRARDFLWMGAVVTS